MKWFKQLFCKHLYTSQYPVRDPETWSWVYECGKCGYKKDVTMKVFNGKIKKSKPDAFDRLIARKRAIGTTESA